jgi:hypothetical protein
MGLAWLGWVALLAFWLVPAALAGHRDSFESAEPTWRLADADCSARIAVQRRDFQTFHTGQASESLTLVAQRGTYAYLVQEVPQSRVIAEWTATLWIKSDRMGLQLLARAVLPRSRDPHTGGPMTVLLRGDVYDRSGLWQQLAIRGADQLLERQVRILRSQFGPDVDPAEAYVDLLVVNAYGGAGVTNLWIDDLELLGQVPAVRFGSRDRDSSNPGAAESPEAAEAWAGVPGRGEIARLNGTVLLVAGRPFFPRAIEYNGEPFEWLHSLGFNTVRLPAAPTVVQLREAERVGLRLIAPPPNDGGITSSHACVIAWDLGSGLGEERLELTRQWVAQVRRADRRPDRPIIGEAVERAWSYSRVLNILVLRRRPLGSSLSLPDYGRWLQTRPAVARAGTPFWATIQTEPALELVEQWSALGLGPPPSLSVEAEQIRLLAYQAVASGVRGLIFSSRSPLDQQDEETQTRARLLKRLNIELTLIEPWVAGGHRADDVPSPAPEIRIGQLQTERSQLLIVLEQSPTQQFTVGPVSSPSLSLVLPSAATAPQVYCLTPAGLQTLSHRRVPGGIRVTLERYGPVCLLAITQDGLVVNHLARTWAENRAAATKLQYELAAGQLQMVEALHSRLTGRTPAAAPVERAMAQARENLQHCEVLLGGSDYPAAHAFAEKALDRLAEVRREHWQQAVRDFPSPSSSPCCAGFLSLLLHGEMARRLQAAPAWSANSLAAGGFESLEHLRATGWQNLSQAGETVRTWVELSPQSPRGAGTSLRLQATAVDPKTPPTALESPPLRIVSPPVPVRRGQLLRIHGWVRVPEQITASPDGLVVYDSVGGPALGERFQVTEGWHEFAFYRAAPADGGVSLTCALTGLGEAALDELSVCVHEPIAAQGTLDEARRLPPTGEWRR